jgi:hypothetical protein
MNLASRIVEAADLEAAHELCYRQNWTDGLPVVPPTRSAIERVLAHLGRDPAELIGIVPPRNGLRAGGRGRLRLVHFRRRARRHLLHAGRPPDDGVRS